MSFAGYKKSGKEPSTRIDVSNVTSPRTTLLGPRLTRKPFATRICGALSGADYSGALVSSAGRPGVGAVAAQQAQRAAPLRNAAVGLLVPWGQGAQAQKKNGLLEGKMGWGVRWFAVK